MRRGITSAMVYALGRVCSRSGAHPYPLRRTMRCRYFPPPPISAGFPTARSFIAEPTGPQPISFDPAHPFIENGIEYNAARPGTKDESIQSTFPVADLSNPILQPWARDELRKLNERVLSGGPCIRANQAAGRWRAGLSCSTSSIPCSFCRRRARSCSSPPPTTWCGTSI
jgi:hypothetical protein